MLDNYVVVVVDDVCKLLKKDLLGLILSVYVVMDWVDDLVSFVVCWDVI